MKLAYSLFRTGGVSQALRRYSHGHHGSQLHSSRANLFAYDVVQLRETLAKKPVRSPVRRELSQWSTIRGKANPLVRGFNKFMNNLRMAHSLVWDAVGGKILNVRERKVLKNTLYDMILLLPSAAIIALPGGSLLLPLVAKYMPWALPSTFQVPTPRVISKLRDDGRAEAEVREELNEDLKRSLVVLADKLKSNHMVEVRLAKQVELALQEFQEVSKGVIPASDLFDTFYELNDDAVISNLDHSQLHILCQHFGAPQAHIYGPSRIMRNWLFDRIAVIETEDLILAKTKSLSNWPIGELANACELRGIHLNSNSSSERRHDDLAKEDLHQWYQSQLDAWIHLTIERTTPVSLVALSRAISALEKLPTEEK